MYVTRSHAYVIRVVDVLFAMFIHCSLLERYRTRLSYDGIVCENASCVNLVQISVVTEPIFAYCTKRKLLSF